MLLPTTLVGSYPQPEWLIDRAKLAGRFPPRVRAKELWRVPEPYLAGAQDDGTLVAIRAQEDAGLDIVTDGGRTRRSRRRSRSPDRSPCCSRPRIVHICFGYAAIIHERPSGYSFLPELAARR